MRRDLIIPLLILLLLPPCAPVGPQTYQGTAFSFAYPADRQTMAELFDSYQPGRDYYQLGFSEQVMVTSARKKGEPGVYFAVATRPLAAGERLEDVFHDTYAKISAEIQDASEATIPIAGQRSERTWMRGCGSRRERRAKRLEDGITCNLPQVIP